MAKPIKGDYHKTMGFGVPYPASVLKAIPKLKGAPWYGKGLAWEAVPRPSGSVGTVVLPVPAKIVKVSVSKSKAIVIDCAVNIANHPLQGRIFQIWHCGKVIVKGGEWRPYGSAVGYVGGKYKFTGDGTGAHIAIILKGKGNKGYADPQPLISWQPPAPKPTPRPPVALPAPKPVPPVVSPIPPQNPPETPILEPKVEKPKEVIPLDKFLLLLKFLKLDKVWEWLDGKKTNIGAGIAILGGILKGLNAVGIIPCYEDKCATDKVADSLILIGAGVATFGFSYFFHKGAK